MTLASCCLSDLELELDLGRVNAQRAKIFTNVNDSEGDLLEILHEHVDNVTLAMGPHKRTVEHFLNSRKPLKALSILKLVLYSSRLIRRGRLLRNKLADG